MPSLLSNLLAPLLLAAAALPAVHALPGPSREHSAAAAADPRQLLGARTVDSGSCNTADNRACWTDGYSIDTDYEVDTPDTGVTRVYYLEIGEYYNWTGPDGFVKNMVQLVNGSWPGPLIEANWGDRVNVTITNKLSTNGTSIHWHGVRQLGTNTEDGVNGVEECPVAPNGTRTYSWRATQYGSSWYHSHFNGQYANGVLGPLLIHGPASANYDIDLGMFPISDWYNQTGDEIVYQVSVYGAGPPTPNNVMLNGTNINPADSSMGAYAEVTLTPNKVHRLRFVNVGAEGEYFLSLAGHNFTVIAADFVPVEPKVVSSVFMSPGMRYDVLINATADVGSYWLNATVDGSGLCGDIGDNTHPAAIFRYEGADTDTLPTDPGEAPATGYCYDDTDLSPVVSRSIDTSSFTAGNNNTLTVRAVSDGSWTVNGTAIDIHWGDPVLGYVWDGNETGIPASDNIVRVDVAADDWAVFLWQGNGTSVSIAHPMHLHGHDLVVLGKSSSAYTANSTFATFSAADVASLNGDNPVRRDTTVLPPFGWAVIAFRADNPGAWVMHCHIAWHISTGLGVTFLERSGDIPTLGAYDQAQYDKTCNAWNAFYQKSPTQQIDSGL